MDSVREDYRSVQEDYRSIREDYRLSKGGLQVTLPPTEKCTGTVQECKKGLQGKYDRLHEEAILD